MAPLAVVGWATSRRSSLLDLYLASYLAACLLFFTSSEYRLPVVPVILLYAACWIANVATWVGGGPHRRLLGSCLLVALVALPINYRDAGAERLTHKRVDYYNFGALYQRRGDWAAAESMFREALRIDPSFAPAASGLGGRVGAARRRRFGHPTRVGFLSALGSTRRRLQPLAAPSPRPACTTTSVCAIIASVNGPRPPHISTRPSRSMPAMPERILISAWYMPSRAMTKPRRMPLPKHSNSTPTTPKRTIGAGKCCCAWGVPRSRKPTGHFCTRAQPRRRALTGENRFHDAGQPLNATLCVRGARAGGLANVDMDLPLGRIICFTGRSSSGRRAMALDILYAESRRRYMQALSPAERESVSGTARADVDEISGLPPAIYLGAPRRGRTVGDYLQLDGILAQIMLEEGQMHCLECGGRCRSYAADEVEREVAHVHPETRCLVLAPLAPAEQSGCGNNSCRPGLPGSQSTARFSDWKATGPALPKRTKARLHVVSRPLGARPELSACVFLEAVRVSRSISSGQTVVWVDGTNEMMHFESAADPAAPAAASTSRWLPLTSAQASPLGHPSDPARTHYGRVDGRPLSTRLRDWLDAASQEGHGRAKVEAALAEACGLELGASAVEPSARIAGGWRVAAPAIGSLSQQRPDGHPLHFGGIG